MGLDLLFAAALDFGECLCLSLKEGLFLDQLLISVVEVDRLLLLAGLLFVSVSFSVHVQTYTFISYIIDIVANLKGFWGFGVLGFWL